MKVKLPDQTKTWRYMLWDHHFPILPVWGVVAMALMVTPFLYAAWPGMVMALAYAVGISGLVYLTIRLVREIRYWRYARASRNDEEKVLTSVVSEQPPFRS